MSTNWVLVCAVVLLAPLPLGAQTPQEKGEALMREAVSRDSGFGNYLVDGSMLLETADGSKAVRKFVMRTLEVPNDGDKRLVTFTEPADLAGMAALIYSHGRLPDDQWLHLPSLRRTKRLAARDKTGSFAGSEFSFEDVSTFTFDKYTYKYMGEDEVGGKACSLVEQTPAYAYSGYSKLIECLDLTIYHPARIQYFDAAGRPYKELLFHDYRQFSKYWRPMKTIMRNLQSGAVSTIDWHDYRFGTSLTEAEFRPDLLIKYSR